MRLKKKRQVATRQRDSGPNFDVALINFSLYFDVLILDSIGWQTGLINFEGNIKEVVVVYYGFNLNNALE
jgi:hypothetical protein